MIRTHFGQHDASCFGCKIQTIQFSNVEPPPQRIMEHSWNKDLPAYYRLRKQGHRPPTTKGCAELEARANTEFEVSMGKLVAPDLWKRAGPAVTDVIETVANGNTSPDGVAKIKEQMVAKS